MKQHLALVLGLLLFAVSCKPYENTMRLAPSNPPIVTRELTYSYSADQIRTEENHLKKAWANRNHVQVLQVSIVNNTDHTIHGSQLQFFSDNERLAIANHKEAAYKLKTKKFPTAVYVIPVAIVGIFVYAVIKNALDPNDIVDDDPLLRSMEKHDKKSSAIKNPNRLQAVLYHFNIATQFIKPGERIVGLIPFKSKTPITKLAIKLNEEDYRVVQH